MKWGPCPVNDQSEIRMVINWQGNRRGHLRTTNNCN
uniref:Uncharacterized protein n=1 Tax=Anguilla anguilla TaxID=7936 RepID=A0A0E9UI00_ANGAN